MAESDLKPNFERKAEEFNAIQQDLVKFVDARQKLEAQLQENKIVQSEFSILEEDAKIYKMIGPVLVPQDKPEAESNVNKRLEFIQNEIKRMETQIADTQVKMEKKRTEVVAARSKLVENLGPGPSTSPHQAAPPLSAN